MNVSTEYTTIAPHGGELVDRMAPEEQRDELLQRAEGLTKITLGPRALSDLEMISTGVFSPLTGFMVSEDYESVVETMRLKNGLVWSLPITLPVSEEEAEDIRVGEEIALSDGYGTHPGDHDRRGPLLLRQGARGQRGLRHHERGASRRRRRLPPEGRAPRRRGYAPGGRPQPQALPCATTTGRANCARSSRRRAGSGSSVSRPATPCTARTSTSRRARWR